MSAAHPINVVVLGAGICGANVTKNLVKNPNVRVTVLTEVPFIEWTITTPWFMTHSSDHAKFLCDTGNAKLAKSLSHKGNAAAVIVGQTLSVGGIGGDVEFLQLLFSS